jgi:hypothetical protein
MEAKVLVLMAEPGPGAQSGNAAPGVLPSRTFKTMVTGFGPEVATAVSHPTVA